MHSSAAHQQVGAGAESLHRSFAKHSSNVLHLTGDCTSFRAWSVSACQATSSPSCAHKVHSAPDQALVVADMWPLLALETQMQSSWLATFLSRSGCRHAAGCGVPAHTSPVKSEVKSSQAHHWERLTGTALSSQEDGVQQQAGGCPLRGQAAARQLRCLAQCVALSVRLRPALAARLRSVNYTLLCQQVSPVWSRLACTQWQ